MGRRPGRVAALVGAVLVVYAVVAAARSAWVCDDAFISFRYADHLVRGHGLVYNEGERVEGYTNLSWTLGVAAAMALGADPVRASQVMGITAYAALLLILLARARGGARARARPVAGGAVPFAAVLVATGPDFHRWATGGLETPLFALLAVGAVLAALPPGDGLGWPALAGLLAGLTATTRPDGVLFAIPAGVAVALGSPAGRDRVRRAASFAAPLGGIGVALVAFKLSYYGDLFPTAFYAKSAADPYYGQGLVYAGLFFAKSWYLVPLALVVAVASRLRPAARAAAPAGPRPAREGWLLAGAGGLFGLYVVHSGGDFMFARRMIPVAVFLALALEELLARVGPFRVRAGIAVAAAALSLVPYPLYGEGRWRIEGIADEPHFYPPEALEARRRQAELLGRIFEGSRARVMIEGGLCMLAYHARLPYVVEMTGLTQRSLAKLPLAERGFIGHEKSPTPEWLRENEIDLVLSQAFPRVGPDPGRRRHDEIFFADLARARILRYDPAVLEPLRRHPEVSMVPIASVVGSLAAEMRAAPPAKAAGMFAYLDRYYFEPAGDAAAADEARVRALLAERGIEAP